MAGKSIIQMAEAYSVGSTLIVGKPQTGRTTKAIELLAGKKVLWLSCNNLGVIATSDKLGEGSKLYVISKWTQFKEILDTIKKGDYQAVVIDGLNNAKDYWFAHFFEDKAVKQSDWADMSKDIARLVSDFRDKAVLFAIVDIERTPDTKNAAGATVKGEMDMALNLDAQKRIIGLFDIKLQTVIETQYLPNPATGLVDAKTSYKTLAGASALVYNN